MEGDDDNHPDFAKVHKDNHVANSQPGPKMQTQKQVNFEPLNLIESQARELSVEQLNFTEEQAMEAFMHFDSDGDGHISSAELSHVLLSLGQRLSAEELDQMMLVAGAQDSEHVTQDQFLKVVMSTNCESVKWRQVTDELGRPRVGGSLHSVSVGSLTKQHELM